MDRIHDKYFNDSRKKKVAISKVQYIESTCCYCPKVFYNSTFLLKHILRRHEEDFMLLQRKCRSNHNICDSKYVLDFIRKEFSAFRNELRQNYAISQDETSAAQKSCELQQNDGNMKDNHNEKVSAKNIYDGIKSQSVSWGDQVLSPNVAGSETIVKEKSLPVKMDIKPLFDDIDRLKIVVDNEIFSKKDIHNLLTANENKILKTQEERYFELQHNLQEYLHSILMHQVSEINVEWKLQFSELSKEFENLRFVVGLLRQQIDSTDHIKSIEKKIETEVQEVFRRKFLEYNRQFENNNKTGQVQKIYTNPDNSFAPGQASLSIKDDETLNCKTTSNVKKNKLNDMPVNNLCISYHELSSIIAVKMQSFGIASCTSKISSEIYTKKMEQIQNLEKQLVKQNQNFTEIYDKTNMYADQRVFSKQKPQKLRFSEPLTLNENAQKPNKKRFHNGVHLVPEDTIHVHPESAILSKNVCSNSRLPKFQRKSHLISGCESLDVSEVSILNKNVHQQPNHHKCDKTFLDNDCFGISESVLETGGDGDCVKSLPKVQRKSKERLHSTPLKEKIAYTPFEKREQSNTVQSVDESNSCFLSPVTPFINDIKDDTAFLQQPQVMSLCPGNDNRELKTCGSSVKPFITQNNYDGMLIASILKDFPNYSFTQAKETYDPSHLNTHLNDKIHLSDVSSLESLSSWEDDENI